MDSQKPSQNWYAYLTIFSLFLVYFLFPTNNSVADAYSYASDIKWNIDLFHPHHLLYNSTGYLIHSFLKLVGLDIEVLSLMKMLNALFAALCLLVLNRIVLVNGDNRQRWAMLLFTGVSFGVMRFATENETYIIPVFFSLVSSYFFIKLLQSPSFINTVLCSLAGSIASLYHQMHFFWWLALLISIFLFSNVNRIKYSLAYIVTALVVPLVYLLVIFGYFEKTASLDTILHFIFRDFYSGGAGTSIGRDNFILTPISFVRTFYQIHGNVVLILKKYLWLAVPGILSIILIIASFRTMDYKQRSRIMNRPVLVSHSIVFFLQLLFAFFSVGNAEFMVMMPFVLMIILTSLEYSIYKPLLYISASMAIWNLSYGILPNHWMNYNGSRELSRLVMTNSHTHYILNDRNLVINEVLYFTGKEPENVYPCPFEIRTKEESKTQLSFLFSPEETRTCTDCVGNNSGFSRASYFKGNIDEEFFKGFSLKPVEDIPTSLESRKLFLVTKKQ